MKTVWSFCTALAMLFLFAQVDVANVAKAQVVEQWVAIYNGMANSEDAAKDIVVDEEGNAYVTGYVAALPASPYNYDFVTAKYDSVGTIVWIAGYNGLTNEDDIPQAIALDVNGNVYVTGWTDMLAGPGTNQDYATVKFDPNGVLMWAVTYNGPGNSVDIANDITVDEFGNSYVTGFSWGMQSSEDYATIMYDPNGIQLWVARYDGPIFGSDEAQAIAIDMNGNAHVTGWSQGMGTDFDYATIQYDPMGTQVWVHRYNGPVMGDDLATDLTLDIFGDVCVTGISYGGVGLNDDIATLMIDPAGVTIWVNRYDWIGEDDGGEAVAVDDQGNVYVTGYSANNPPIFQNFDYATIMYSATGALLWVSRYDGPISEDDKARDIEVDDYGDVYVTGWCTAADTTKDYCTLKYSVTGAQLWVMHYNGPNGGDDLAQALALSPEGHCFVTGWINGYTGIPYDWATVKYTPTVMVWLTPNNAPIQIPASGGSFDYNIAVRNFDTAATTVDVWCNATLPSGTMTGPVLGPVNLTLAAGFGGGRNRTQTVPAGAPPGTYSFNGYAGIYPTTFWDKDHFFFEKLTDGDGEGIDEWASTGESFSEWFNTNDHATVIPTNYSLGQNYPNPFNPTTAISYQLSAVSFVNLTVYDVTGCLVPSMDRIWLRGCMCTGYKRRGRGRPRL